MSPSMVRMMDSGVRSVTASSLIVTVREVVPPEWADVRATFRRRIEVRTARCRAADENGKGMIGGNGSGNIKHDLVLVGRGSTAVAVVVRLGDY